MSEMPIYSGIAWQKCLIYKAVVWCHVRIYDDARIATQSDNAVMMILTTRCCSTTVCVCKVICAQQRQCVASEMVFMRKFTVSLSDIMIWYRARARADDVAARARQRKNAQRWYSSVIMNIDKLTRCSPRADAIDDIVWRQRCATPYVCIWWYSMVSWWWSVSVIQADVLCRAY